MIKLYIPTCDKYHTGMHANIITMEKYWPKEIEVIILGYEYPKYNLPAGYTFISLGQDRGAQYWGEDMMNYFSTINDEYIIYDNDDTILLKEVKYNHILSLLNVMKSNKNITKINLTGDLCTRKCYNFNITDSENEIIVNNLVYADQFTDYRLSVQGSIWKKDYFYKYLRNDINPWQYEVHQSAIAKNDGAVLLGTTNIHPIIRGHLYRKGKSILNLDPGREWFKAWNPTGYNPHTKQKYQLDIDLYNKINQML